MPGGDAVSPPRVFADDCPAPRPAGTVPAPRRPRARRWHASASELWTPKRAGPRRSRHRFCRAAPGKGGSAPRAERKTAAACKRTGARWCCRPAPPPATADQVGAQRRRGQRQAAVEEAGIVRAQQCPGASPRRISSSVYTSCENLLDLVAAVREVERLDQLAFHPAHFVRRQAVFVPADVQHQHVQAVAGVSPPHRVQAQDRRRGLQVPLRDVRRRRRWQPSGAQFRSERIRDEDAAPEGDQSPFPAAARRPPAPSSEAAAPGATAARAPAGVPAGPAHRRSRAEAAESIRPHPRPSRAGRSHASSITVSS